VNLNERIRKRVCDSIRCGNHPHTAAVANGIPSATHYLWLRKGKEESESLTAGNDPVEKNDPYLKYYLHIERAKAESEAAAVKTWTDKLPDDWRAARDFLARRFPDRWGKKDEVTLNTPDFRAELKSRIEKSLGKEPTDTDE